ncbi:MAG: 4Fe-4S dicluster domain-containing protein [Candidatus Hodarchaeota archaeon]
MVKITAIKEALKALFKPATTKYPFGPPSHLPPGLRGLPQFDKEKCIGCGACVVSCSAKAISLKDDDHTRTLSIFYPRCIFCGRCEDICPEDGITLSEQFEIAINDKDQATVTINFDLVPCEKCGTPVSTPQHLEKIRTRIIENIDARLTTEVIEDLSKYLNLCSECRRKSSYQLNTHPQKYYSRRWEE